MLAHSICGVECARELRAGRVLFFLIQKESGSETFSRSSLLTSARLLSLLMSSRSALIGMHLKRKREELYRVVVELLI